MPSRGHEMAESAEATVETPSGAAFVTESPGSDPSVVLMHGFPDDHTIYDRLVPLLQPNRAVAFDWVGYGRSARPADPPFTAEAHGAQLEAVLDAFSMDDAVLVGHDASGPDAIEYTLGNPDRVSHLVLLNTYFGHRPSLRLPEMIRLFAEPELAALADALVEDENQRLWLVQQTGIRFGLEPLDPDPDAIGNKSIVPQFFGNDVQGDALVAIRRWTGHLFEDLDAQDRIIASGALERLAAPVTFIFGKNDPFLSPAFLSELSPLFGDPTVHLVEGAGHWPQHDRPDTVTELLGRALTAPRD
jgi:haloalkane dehalogenase